MVYRSSRRFANSVCSWLRFPFSSLADGYAVDSSLEASPPARFEALEPRILLSTITSISTGDWSDPNTWDLGTTPGAGDDVVIDSSDTVTYDTTDSDILGSVDIDGTLTFDANTSLDLYSEGNIEVGGTLKMHPSSASVTHTITFENVDESAFVGGGLSVLASDVGLWITGDGYLDAIGTSKTPWTNLTGSANVNDTSITVDDATGWQVGDSLAITPTQAPTVGTASWDGYDERTISSISGNTITLDSALSYDHPEVNNTWTAEVLNLTRNVKIGGTASGRSHVMFQQVNNPQTVKNVEVQYVGPQQDTNGDGYMEGVAGAMGSTSIMAATTRAAR